MEQTVVEIVIGVCTVISAYWVNRLVDRERTSKQDREVRDWVQKEFVPREILDSKLEGINQRMGQLDKRIAGMHRENSSKLDHLLAIVSTLSGLSGKPAPFNRRHEEGGEEE